MVLELGNLGATAPVEFIHGRNRQRAHENMTFPKFHAASTNGESFLRLGWQQKALRIFHKLGKLSKTELKRLFLGPDDAKPKRFRAASFRDVVKNEIISHRSAAGQGTDILSVDVKTLLAETTSAVRADPVRMNTYVGAIESETDRRREAFHAAAK